MALGLLLNDDDLFSHILVNGIVDLPRVLEINLMMLTGCGLPAIVKGSNLSSIL